MKRAAIIGCGTIFQVHLPIIVANPEIELCAVCDNNPAVQEKAACCSKRPCRSIRTMRSFWKRSIPMWYISACRITCMCPCRSTLLPTV